MDTSTIKIWRVIDLLKWSKAYLADKGVASPQIEVEWLLRHVLNCSRIDIYLNHERPLNPEELAIFKKLLLERSRGIPLQYVLGYTEFMGHRFLVNSDVLIPRPETEIVVEKVLNWLRAVDLGKPAVLDVGTGSGCIAVSIAAEYKRCSVLALDISEKALVIARKNAIQNSVERQIRFLRKDILHESPGDCQFNIIVSNPPYVAGEYWENLEVLVRENEPEIALNPGKDELIFYRRLSELANRHLTENGILAMEIGGDYQEKDVSQIVTQGGLKIREVVKDYTGQSRGIIAEQIP